MPTNIKVLIVDDSALIRKILTEIITNAPGIEVVGSASDPYIARDKIKKLNPDVITLDVEMPRMDGISFLKNLMRLRPMPVIMISTLTEKGAAITLEALSIGAIDYLPKPKANEQEGLTYYASEIIDKIRTAAAAKIAPIEHIAQSKARKKIASASSGVYRAKPGMVVAIGASTGGTEAIKDVLLAMPSNCPPVLIAQHIPEGFSQSYALRLDGQCAMHVHEAVNGQIIEQGNAYLAPGDEHLTIKRRGSEYVCLLSRSEPVNRHRPSVDVLFNSVAQVCGKESCGALLTGMGADGAKGLLNMKTAGAYTLIQNEATSVVWGMPGAAAALNAHYDELPLNRVAARLLERSGRYKEQQKAK